MARSLPIVELEIDDEKVQFFADERLREYRAVDNPHNIVLDDDVDVSMDEIICEFGVMGTV